MCGIFGSVQACSSRTCEATAHVLLAGLKRLEYRGYDSAGIALDGPEIDTVDGPVTSVMLFKYTGKIADLTRHVEATMTPEQKVCVVARQVGIGHTRWATHGVPCDRNCHPHVSDDGVVPDFLVVHNGIITNYMQLKQMLVKHGYVFHSDTDTEVAAKLAHFVFYQMRDRGSVPSFAEVVAEVCRYLDGAFAFVFKSPLYPGECVAVKRGSPLIVGIVGQKGLQRKLSVRTIASLQQLKDIASMPTTPTAHATSSSQSLVHVDVAALPQAIASNEVTEFILASDASAIIEHTRNVVVLEDDDLVHMFDGQIKVRNLRITEAESRPVEKLELELEQIQKGEFAHFMLKEIYEQVDSVQNTMRGRINYETGQVTLGGLLNYIADIRRCRRIIFIACGTSYHSALSMRPIIEELAEIAVSVENAGDFLDRTPAIFRDDVCVFVSQSGETKDTLLALEYCQKRSALLLGITNTVGSEIARRTTCGIHLNAGIEIGVASTKAYTSQMVAMALFALMLGDDRISKQPRRREIIEALRHLPENIHKCLQLNEDIKRLAEELKGSPSCLLLGRGYQFPACLEGALKIKEIAYIHSEGLHAGELKHGPLALVDSSIPVIVLVVRDRLYDQTLNALNQLTSREAHPVIVCNESDVEEMRERLKLPADSPLVLGVPSAPDCIQGILTIIPLQLLSYHLAVLRRLNVDQPRNLAKSVTTS